MTTETQQPTASIKLTDFHIYIASGSGISDPKANSGYDEDLVHELHRVVNQTGNTVTLTAKGFRDLAEFANDLANSVAQEPNPSGARSLSKLAERCLAQAKTLES